MDNYEVFFSTALFRRATKALATEVSSSPYRAYSEVAFSIADRLETLEERIKEIDDRHTRVGVNGIEFDNCQHCWLDWPCPDHKSIHPGEV